MSRTPRWLAPLALTTTAALLFAACGAAATPTPAASESAAPSESAAASESAAPFEALSYPTAAAVDCAAKTFNGKPYTGEFQSMTALDANTVEFKLCVPDVAFLPKIAFSSFAINDADYLAKAAADGSIVEKPNGTGPYMLKEWVRGDHITMVANPNWRGEPVKAQEVIFKWSDEPAQRFVELQSGQVDGIDNVGPDDFAGVEGDSSLKLYPREGTNVMYLGMNNAFRPFNNEKVRQAIAMGINRQRIVDNFYAPGSTVADWFTPCSVPNACGGPEWYKFDPVAAKGLLAAGLAEEGITGPLKTTIHLRDKDRSYISRQTVVAQDIQAQLKANLGIEAAIDVQESGTFLDNSDSGTLDGLHILGWGMDYPDMTNWVDYHFGAGSSKQFGDKYDDLVAAISEGAVGLSDAERKPIYEKVNELIKQRVPMVPIAHAGSAVAFKADVEGAHSSPLSSEVMAVMKPGDRNQLIWVQNAEPPGIYCADETDGEALRACVQMTEGLYSYEVGGTATEPALAKECKPSPDLMTWTCTLLEGVKFADGSTFDANDVVTSLAAQWDTEHPLHKGNTSAFTYFSALFGGYLNPPAE